MTTCSLTESTKALLGACEGPQWVCRGYFVDGTDDKRCEKHAKASMAMNPAGPTYVPQASSTTSKVRRRP